LLKFLFSHLFDDKLYKYILVGGSAAIVDISFFLLLNKFLTTHYLVNASISFLIATLVNYILCVKFVFNSKQQYSTHTEILFIYLISAIGLFIHHTLLFSGFELLGLPMIIAKLFAMGIAFIWNFLSRKHIVFKEVAA